MRVLPLEVTQGFLRGSALEIQWWLPRRHAESNWRPAKEAKARPVAQAALEALARRRRA